VKAEESFAGTGQVTVKSFLAADPDGSTTQYTMESPITFDVVALKGDVNSNGKINSADISAIVREMLNSAGNTKADVNGNGKVNSADITAVVREILSLN